MEIIKAKHAVWALGFRPFFLLASVFAVVSILAWLGFYTASLPLRFTMPPFTWHAHEMIFGFATAVVAGFLLTATQNWTGKPGLSGRRLQILVALWVVARILNFFPDLVILSSIANLSFYPAFAYFLFPYLSDPSQKRNYIFFLLFSVLFISQAVLHAGIFGYLNSYTRSAYLLALHSILVMIILIGGRVIPFFTEKAIPRARVKRSPTLEKLVMPSTFLFLILDFFLPEHPIYTVLCALLFVLHLYRWYLWNPLQTRAVPVLAILYIAYLWLAFGFLFYALSSIGLMNKALSIHAFAIGALGTIILGMVNRVSHGHTGRPIRANKYALSAYLLILLSPILRVVVPYIFPQYTYTATWLAGLSWALAFSILSFSHFKLWLSPRPDGRPG